MSGARNARLTQQKETLFGVGTHVIFHQHSPRGRLASESQLETLCFCKRPAPTELQMASAQRSCCWEVLGALGWQPGSFKRVLSFSELSLDSRAPAAFATGKAVESLICLRSMSASERKNSQPRC
eukprot:492204-Amphidinium_carterae.1